jgi:hypothetical protein
MSQPFPSPFPSPSHLIAPRPDWSSIFLVSLPNRLPRACWFTCALRSVTMPPSTVLQNPNYIFLLPSRLPLFFLIFAQHKMHVEWRAYVDPDLCPHTPIKTTDLLCTLPCRFSTALLLLAVPVLVPAARSLHRLVLRRRTFFCRSYPHSGECVHLCGIRCVLTRSPVFPLIHDHQTLVYALSTDTTFGPHCSPTHLSAIRRVSPCPSFALRRPHSFIPHASLRLLPPPLRRFATSAAHPILLTRTFFPVQYAQYDVLTLVLRRPHPRPPTSACPLPLTVPALIPHVRCSLQTRDFCASSRSSDAKVEYFSHLSTVGMLNETC